MLIICPECGRGVSEFANGCPNCGLPMAMFEKAKRTRSSIMSEGIDLGLPSGILWASANVGAKSPYDIGRYFAWGDSSIKESYVWENYKYFLGYIRQNEYHTYPRLSKYVCHTRLGIIDNKSYLESIDDPATILMGEGWRTPSYEEQRELLDHCRIEATSIKGVNGYTIIGPNGNSIFFINTGYIQGEVIKEIDKPVFWLNESNPFGYENASTFCVIKGVYGLTLGTVNRNRNEGLVIRAVRK